MVSPVDPAKAGGQLPPSTDARSFTTEREPYYPGQDSPEVVRYDAYPEVVPSHPQPEAIPSVKEGLQPTFPKNGPTPTIDTITSPTLTSATIPYGRKDGEKASKQTLLIYVLIGALVLVTIIAAVVGGVVGSNAVRDAKEQCTASLLANSDFVSTTTTTTTVLDPSATSPPDPTGTIRVPDTGFVVLDCPVIDGQEWPVDLGSDGAWTFDLTCGAGFSRGAGTDILAIISYDLYHCLQACASLNQLGGRDVCVGAEYHSNLDVAFTYAGNCFLSNGTELVTDVQADGDEGDRKVGAVLQPRS